MIARGFSLSESLFSDDNTANGTESGTVERSPEMQRLLEEGNAKAERRKKKPKTIAASVFNRALVEVDEMIRTGDWASATARHLVALYDRMHAKCYGVEVEELGSSERYTAALLAGNMVKNKFDGDVVACVSYMRWAWTREISRERWRRENKQPGGRIGVRLMFSGALLTDFRLAQQRNV
jgi:hypothetical protein